MIWLPNASFAKRFLLNVTLCKRPVNRLLSERPQSLLIVLCKPNSFWEFNPVTEGSAKVCWSSHRHRLWRGAHWLVALAHYINLRVHKWVSLMAMIYDLLSQHSEWKFAPGEIDQDLSKFLSIPNFSRLLTTENITDLGRTNILDFFKASETFSVQFNRTWSIFKVSIASSSWKKIKNSKSQPIDRPFAQFFTISKGFRILRSCLTLGLKIV